MPARPAICSASDWKFSGALKGDINERLSYILHVRPALRRRTPATARAAFRSRPSATAAPNADLDTYQIIGRPRLRRQPQRQALGRPARPAARRQGGDPVPAPTTRSTPRTTGAMAASSARPTPRPEIGLRVALTYKSKISYDLDTTESRRLRQPGQDRRRNAAIGDARGPDRHQREDTLIFGSIRWVDWSEFAIAPPMYGDVTALIRRAARAGRLSRGLVDLQHRRRAAAHRRTRRLRSSSPTSRRSTRC